ncbi:MAG: NosD domain-containing protein, partial [Candidatus Kapaibacterium sp.]
MRNFGAKRRVRFSESYVVNGDLTVANNELFDRKSWIKGDSVRPPKNGNVDLYTGEAPLSFKNHKLDGIRIIELQDFIMHDNVFRYCLNGLHNMGFFLNVYDNRFISCASGSYCESVGTFCSNKFTRCEKSLDLANSGSSNITNNAFAQAGSGIWVASGATAYIKGNNFADFYHGVQTSNASVNLSGIYTVVNTSEADRIKIGHNQFGTGQPTTLENFRINSSQFTHSINNISDINFTNQYDYADMRCGKNIMTPVSNTYHLFKEKEDVNGVLVDIPLRRAIMVKRNDWNHNSGTHQVIRNFASGIPQVPIAEIVQLDEGELSTPCAT